MESWITVKRAVITLLIRKSMRGSRSKDRERGGEIDRESNAEKKRSEQSLREKR